MTEIAFHFNAPDKLAYACRLLRKAVASGAKVVVTGDETSLQTLDTLLWTFSALEFLPHCRADSPLEQRMVSPIVLAAQIDGNEALPHHQVLLNLSDAVMPGYERFERTIEVVTLDEQDRQNARQRWKHYADRGYAITRHDLKLRENA
ncbi:DNA polymerase III subunit chi [Limnohabitans sp. JirII-31]|uniref:DNA polymerase III subunit chi n=1 Tax=Limnohabitans sp. JirII-31 TaxID=1977908 RepID=UPI000C1DC963|nr:DNA polymerase III subunit chi [Limnohabitans sp. JirII-31]PIT80801.1 DNA polymerase III subunit chi [Limnohabitans sp. JirII-31]